MGPCAFRDKPQGNIIEINDDIVARQAEELAKKRAYEVPHFGSQEEVLVSLAANMQAMSQTIRSKNAFHLNKLQRMKKSKAFTGFVTGMSHRISLPKSHDETKAEEEPYEEA